MSLGVRPGDFWGMTFCELSMFARGAVKAQNDKWKLAAWHAANTINVHLKKQDRVTPAKLLGKEISASSYGSAEEMREATRKLRG